MVPLMGLFLTMTWLSWTCWLQVLPKVLPLIVGVLKAMIRSRDVFRLVRWVVVRMVMVLFRSRLAKASCPGVRVLVVSIRFMARLLQGVVRRAAAQRLKLVRMWWMLLPSVAPLVALLQVMERRPKLDPTLVRSVALAMVRSALLFPWVRRNPVLDPLLPRIRSLTR